MNDDPRTPLQKSGLDQQVGFVLREAVISVWANLRRTLDPHGLKPQTYAALLIIDTNPGCKQQDIADALGIQRPNQVAMIESLLAEGLIDRQVNPEDRRSYNLSLTEAGKQLLMEAQASHVAHEKRITAILGPDINPALIETLKRLTRI